MVGDAGHLDGGRREERDAEASLEQRASAAGELEDLSSRDGRIDAASGRAITGLEQQREIELKEQAVREIFQAGDRVLHAILGPGRLIDIEAGGIVRVRFTDGSDRRLLATAAALCKVAPDDRSPPPPEPDLRGPRVC